ncbi:MAG: serine/threonine protein kinase, partial [Phycisphaerae bacterium]|nr:serine/threonine protein kinase [Phycisphaerae bacterium]
GRGGFGEVYYALSDGGKEVALKYLRDNPQIELRGVEHCMNLKSPYLVTVYDVRQNAQGEYFIVMEYIAGPSLRDLLVAEDKGLGVQKAAFFLREIGKGLGYLHDRGIVHRDLKPGNIFYEDGYVKIGDYGLSKCISVSRHSAQTTSVGTVHYMAPEVGTGNYHRGIDIYALGVILYEMLLGRVPFEGSSMGEVLMKHLMAQPEVAELPAPFGEVITKALAKEPADRYQSVDEMTSAVFGAEDIRNSVARFEPTSVSMAAARVVPQRVAAGVGGSSREIPAPPVIGSPRAWEGSSAVPAFGGQYPGLGAGRGGRGRLGDRLRRGVERLRPQLIEPPGSPLRFALHANWLERLLMAGLVAGALSAGIVLLDGGVRSIETMLPTVLLLVLAMASAAMIGGALAQRLRTASHQPLIQRLLVFGVGLVLILLAGAVSEELFRPSPYQWPNVMENLQTPGLPQPTRSPAWTSYGRMLDSVAPALILVMALVDWTRRVRRASESRIELGDAITAGITAAVVCLFFEGSYMLLAGGIAATASLTVGAGTCFRLVDHSRTPSPPPRAGGQGASPPPFAPTARIADERTPTRLAQHPMPSPDFAPGAPPRPPARRSGMQRAIWGVVAAILLSGALLCFAALGVTHMHRDDTMVTFAVALSLLSLEVFALSRTTRFRRATFYRETVRPLLISVALGVAAVAFSVLLVQPLRGDEFAITVSGLIGGLALAGMCALFIGRDPSAPDIRAKGDRIAWALVSGVLVAACVALFACCQNGSIHPEEAAMATGGALACLAGLAFTLSKVTPFRRRGSYRETLRPLLISLCLVSCALSVGWITQTQLREDEAMVAMGFLIVPAVFALFFLIVRGSRVVEEPSRRPILERLVGREVSAVELLGWTLGLIIAASMLLAILGGLMRGVRVGQ